MKANIKTFTIFLILMNLFSFLYGDKEILSIYQMFARIADSTLKCWTNNERMCNLRPLRFKHQIRNF